MQWWAGFGVNNSAVRKADAGSLGRPPVHTPHGAALPVGVCVCPAGWGLRFGLIVYKRQDSSLCPPTAAKTVSENQSEVSTQELTLEKNLPNKPTFLNERPSG